MTAKLITGLKRNIKLNYIFTGLMGSNPASALWVVYMASKGISLGQIGVAEALLHITVFLMEVPTGIAADLLGRRVSRLLGAVLWFASSVMMVFSATFLEFCLAFMVTGIAITLESGAGEALLYDSLKVLGLEGTYQKTAGRIVTVINMCEAAAILMGGLLSDLRFTYAYLAAAAIEFAAVIVSLFFTEPPLGEQNNKGSTKASGDKRTARFLEQLSSCIGLLKQNKRVIYIIVMNGVLDMTACLVYFYGREIFKEGGLSQGVTGLFYMLYCLIGAGTALLIHRLDERYGEKRLIMAMCLMLTLGFGSFALGLGPMKVASFLLIGLVYGATFPLFSDYINKEVPSEYRATILSLNGAMFSLSMITFFPLVGLLGDAAGLGRAFVLISIPVALVLVLLALVTFRRGRVPKAPAETEGIT